MSDPLPELSERGLVYQQTHPELGEHLGREPFTLYAGFDPTAESLHVGSLVPLLGLARFQRAGHRPIALAGGGTGMIGDPSGKTSERTLLDREVLSRNVTGIRRQLEQFLDFEDPAVGAILLDNSEWLTTYPLVDFLRDIGKHFSVGAMLAKESVRSRLGGGISFTEFAYVLLQSYDFLHLHDEYGCRLQVGGQDQWGNITAGMDLVRRLRGVETFGLTFPLVTLAGGQKFGKTEAGTVWLDESKTSPYELYQYFINTDDDDVIDHLGWLTFVPVDEIKEYRRLLEREPEKREAQRRLAREVTALVHGEGPAALAEKASEILFGGGEIRGATDEVLEGIFADVPRCEFPRSALESGKALVEAMVEVGAAKSRGDARRLVTSGAVQVNNQTISDPRYELGRSDLASSHVVVLRRGKRNYYLIRFVD